MQTLLKLIRDCFIIVCVVIVGVGFFLLITELNPKKNCTKIENIDGEQILVGKDTVLIFKYKNTVLAIPKK